MSDGASAEARVFAFPVARQNGIAPPSWIAAATGEVRAAAFGRAAPAQGPARTPEAPAAAPVPAPPAPAPEPAPPRADSSAAAFARAAVEHATAHARAIAGVEAQLLELSIAIASAIVEREIERDPSLHAALARSALETLGNPAGARLRASHEAYAAILDSLGAPTVVVDGVSVQVTLDPTLEGVGCVAENDQARVDARIGERLRAIRRALEDERRRLEVEEAG